MSTTLNAKAAYYHLSPLNGDSTSKWNQGGPLKGTVNGQKAIGLVMFDKAEISGAIGANQLQEASLTLHRNTNYDTGAVDISIAPVMGVSVPEKATYAECMEMASRGWHYVTAVSGAASEIKLPGAWLYLLKNNPFAGLIIYQEDGEGTTEPARFTAAAELKLTTGTALKEPIWLRGIGSGDVISDETHSHIADLYELLYYINYRKAADNETLSPPPEPLLTPTTFTGIDIGLYKDWKSAITALRTGINAIYTAEGKTEVSWSTIGNDDLPSAAVINQLRNALEVPSTGDAEYLEIADYSRAYFRRLGADFVANLNQDVRWRKGENPEGGHMNEYEEVEAGVRRKAYYRFFSCWHIIGLLAGKTVTSAKLRVTRTKGNTWDNEINLYPVIASTPPDTNMTVNNVMDTSIVVGNGSAAVGETVDIALSSDFITALGRAISGTEGTKYYGIGVNDTQVWSRFAASATLIINDSE